MNIKERALKDIRELANYPLSLCLSTLAFLGIIISVFLFGLGAISVDQTSRWVFLMFVVFVIDQLFVKRLSFFRSLYLGIRNWLKSKKLFPVSK